jgi:hypothetical protein
MIAMASLDFLNATTTALDWLGTAAFAISGAIVGVRKRFDLFGVLFLSFVVAVAGGVMRDVLIGAVPLPRSAIHYFVIAMISGLITFSAMAVSRITSVRSCWWIRSGWRCFRWWDAKGDRLRHSSGHGRPARDVDRDRRRDGARCPERGNPVRPARGSLCAGRIGGRGRGRGRNRFGMPTLWTMLAAALCVFLRWMAIDRAGARLAAAVRVKEPERAAKAPAFAARISIRYMLARSGVKNEVGDQSVEFLGVFDHRPMAAAVHQDHAGIGDIGIEDQRVLVMHHAVVAAVDQQHGICDRARTSSGAKRVTGPPASMSRKLARCSGRASAASERALHKSGVAKVLS